MNATPKTAPYGAWQSPITPDAIVADSLRLGQVAVDGGAIYWTEGRPQERGRTVLVRRNPDGSTTDLTPSPYNVRASAHEYGGGAFTVADGVVFFTNYGDHAVYRIDAGGVITALLAGDARRYADFIVDARRQRLIAVCEDHRAGGEPVTTLVAIGFDGTVVTLASGADFYAAPRLSPDGTALAWIQWWHPNLPWDGTELRLALLAADGPLEAAQTIAGAADESVFQPEWSPDGVLTFVSDRSG